MRLDEPLVADGPGVDRRLVLPGRVVARRRSEWSGGAHCPAAWTPTYAWPVPACQVVDGDSDIVDGQGTRPAARGRAPPRRPQIRARGASASWDVLEGVDEPSIARSDNDDPHGGVGQGGWATPAARRSRGRCRSRPGGERRSRCVDRHRGRRLDCRSSLDRHDRRLPVRLLAREEPRRREVGRRVGAGDECHERRRIIGSSSLAERREERPDRALWAWTAGRWDAGVEVGCTEARGTRRGGRGGIGHAHPADEQDPADDERARGRALRLARIGIRMRLGLVIVSSSQPPSR